MTEPATTIFYILILILCLCMIGFAVFTLWQNITNIPPFVPSFGKADFQKILQELKLPPNARLIDLGCGDGKVLRWAAPYVATAHGVEINPFVALWGKVRCKFSPYQAKLHVAWGNMYKQDVSDFDVVYTYLYPSTMQQLEQKLFSELRPGSYVISNTFKFTKHQPILHQKRMLAYKI